MVDTALHQLLPAVVLLRSHEQVLALLAPGDVHELGELEHAALAAQVPLGSLVEDRLAGRQYTLAICHFPPPQATHPPWVVDALCLWPVATADRLALPHRVAAQVFARGAVGDGDDGVVLLLLVLWCRGRGRRVDRRLGSHSSDGGRSCMGRSRGSRSGSGAVGLNTASDVGGRLGLGSCRGRGGHGSDVGVLASGASLRRWVSDDEDDKQEQARLLGGHVRGGT